MTKVALAFAASFAILASAGCAGKAPIGKWPIGKEPVVVPAPAPAPAAAPVVTRG